jgi:hypothetical protein
VTRGDSTPPTVNVSFNVPVLALQGGSDPPPGPYVIHRYTRQLFPVRRLVSDTQKAFIYGVSLDNVETQLYREEAAKVNPVSSFSSHP